MRFMLTNYFISNKTAWKSCANIVWALKGNTSKFKSKS